MRKILNKKFALDFGGSHGKVCASISEVLGYGVFFLIMLLLPSVCVGSVKKYNLD